MGFLRLPRREKQGKIVTWEVILTLVLFVFGSGIVGSIWVAYYQFSLQRELEINREIERVYLDEGIDRIVSDLSRYGLSCFNTVVYVMRSIDGVSDVREFLSHVSERQAVRELIGYDYTMATPCMHKLLFFDKDFRLFKPVVNVFFTWSLFVQDVTDYQRAQEWLSDPNWKKSLEGAAELAQDMMMYLNTRLLHLSNWIRERNYRSFADLKNDIQVKKMIEPLSSEMAEFYRVWAEWHASSGVDRQRASQTLHDWIAEKLGSLPSLGGR